MTFPLRSFPRVENLEYHKIKTWNGGGESFILCEYQSMLPPCHFLLYSSNTIGTLRKKLTGWVILILIISTNYGNKSRNLMQDKILYTEVYLPLHVCHQFLISVMSQQIFAHLQMGIRWHVYVMEQVMKSVSQIKRVNNLQSIIL